MDFSLVDAQINFFRSNYGKSRDTILKYLHNLNGTSKAIKLYYLGKIEQKEENHLLAIKYYEKIDSIVNTTGDPFPEIKDVYQQLVMHSTLENEKRKQVEYIEKLIHYDSLLSSNQGGILNQIMISYDLPYLKRQKKQAEEQLKAKNTAVTAVGFLAGLALTSGGFFYYRSRKMKIRLKLLLDGIENKKVIPRKLGEHPAAVPEEIREFILKQLELFESSDLFLSKGLDMSTLAQELGTNTTYLSLIINHYKKMTFPNYLKDLKISCAIHRLGNDSELLRYNYQGLAEMFGFKTAESFSKAFYNKTGVYPSKFLNELKSRETTRHL
jgi:AraC-like DNA-binding protein